MDSQLSTKTKTHKTPIIGVYTTLFFQNPETATPALAKTPAHEVEPRTKIVKLRPQPDSLRKILEKTPNSAMVAGEREASDMGNMGSVPSIPSGNQSLDINRSPKKIAAAVMQIEMSCEGQKDMQPPKPAKSREESGNQRGKTTAGVIPEVTPKTIESMPSVNEQVLRADASQCGPPEKDVVGAVSSSHISATRKRLRDELFPVESSTKRVKEGEQTSEIQGKASPIYKSLHTILTKLKNLAMI